MEISVEGQHSCSIVNLAGRLDGTTMQLVETEFLALIERGEKRFIVDMSQLEYISSAGLRVMLAAMKKTKAIGGKIVLASLSDNVQEVFNISGFSKIFPIYSSREEALEFVTGD